MPVSLTAIIPGLNHDTTESPFPRLLVSNADKEEINAKITNWDWAASIYHDMVETVTPLVKRHQTDPQWILSRYQMNWEPGAHYTKHISDPEGTELIDWSGNAPYPTVRVTTHKRPPVAPDGYRYRMPPLEDVNPYDTESLWYMQSSGPSGEWSYAEPRLFTGNVNGRINNLAVQSAVLYWLTGEEHFAQFTSDILFQWARGAYYQDPVEGAGRNGLFCIQSLGDRNYDDLAVAYDFVRLYMDEAGYETRYFQPVFEKLAKTTKLRGFITNNWYAAQTTTLTYNALSLDDAELRDYYLSFYLERDTIDGRWGQLGLPTTLSTHFTDDGHWKENAGYHDMPVGDLLMAAVPVENNGYRVFEDHPALFQASYAMLRYSFPNLQLMGYGDIGGRRNQSPRNLEIAIRYASEYAPDLLPGLMGSLNRLIDAGLYDRSRSGWYGLLTYLADLPDVGITTFEWDRTFSLDFARLYGHRNGTDQETGLMYYVQGATYNHNHANGMAMELYGRGYILGADPGIASTYEDSVFVHYLATFAAHNTVIAAGASEPSVPFTGSGGAKHMGEINLSAMEPLTAQNGVSPYISFTETDYLEPSTQTLQQRAMAIIRTSSDTGYYVDIYRSDNQISNDYLYHNIGHRLTLHNASREELAMQPGVIPYQPDRQSGMGWFENINTTKVPTENAISVFKLEETGEDVFMQMLTPLQPADKIFTATGPRTRTAPTPINHLPTPKTIIHRPEAAWDEPFAVIYEPYRGGDGYSVESVRRIETAASLVALEVENRDGSRQVILQSDTPDVLANVRKYTGSNGSESTRYGVASDDRPDGAVGINNTGSNTPSDIGKGHLEGHFGVVALNTDLQIEYLYLGHGTSLGWNGYQIRSQNNKIGANVMFNDNSFVISSTETVELHLPYRISLARDDQGNELQILTDTSENVSLMIPAGTDRTVHFTRTDQ
ncbi:MAG: hypothetical protein LAT57_01930 [Balneolales bacterium]|nr:hypothetical protein [Balneolales bacterium]